MPASCGMLIFRMGQGQWGSYAFRGSRWTRMRQEDSKTYLKNAYRVLLTRARQGMVIVVPEGNHDDPTRVPRFYDETYAHLKDLGLSLLE